MSSGFSYPQPISQSPIYNPAFYLTLDASITPGTATQGVALVVGTDGGLSGLGAISCSSLTVNGSSVSAPPSYIQSITPGTAANGTVLVLDSSGVISGITSLGATSIVLTNTSASTSSTTGAIQCAGDAYIGADSIIDGNLKMSTVGVMTIQNTQGSIGSTSGAFRCMGGAYFGQKCRFDNAIETAYGIRQFSLGTVGGGKLSGAQGYMQWWNGTTNTEILNIYRTSDTTGLNIATTQTTTSNAKAYPILTLTSTDNVNSTVAGVSATSADLFLINWNSKQGTGASFANQAHRFCMDIGFTRNTKSGCPATLTLATSSDVLGFNVAGSSATPSSGCLYLISDTINKLVFNSDTPYTNASYGTATVSMYGNMFIKSNNSFNDGTSTWNMPLCLSNANASEMLFAFQMNNGAASTSTNSTVMGTVSNNDYRLMTNNSSRVIITAAGRVGIATMTPAYQLQVAESVSSTIDAAGSGVAYFLKSGGLVSTVGPISSVAVAIGATGAILASAGVYTTSDARIKKGFTELSDSVADAMLKVNPLMFRYKTQDDSTPLQLGYRAQDLIRAGLPHCINFIDVDDLPIEDVEVDTLNVQYSVD